MLPVTAASASRPVTTLGPLELRVANAGGDLLGDLRTRSSTALAHASISRAAEMGTHGEGCSTNIFAYVTLGSWGTSDPVVVR